MKIKFTKNLKGFTIIEVMIVLAVAALILLAVFLAIPNLQRSSRNSGRKADAGRVGTAATNFKANNNNVLPTSAADAGTVLNDAGTLAQYSLTGAGDGIVGCAASIGNTAANANKLYLCKGPAGVGATVTLNQPAANTDLMVLGIQATCGAPAGGVTNGTARQMALLYTVEVSGANQPTWACLNL